MLELENLKVAVFMAMAKFNLRLKDDCIDLILLRQKEAFQSATVELVSAGYVVRDTGRGTFVFSKDGQEYPVLVKRY